MDPKAAQELIDQLRADGDEDAAREAQEDLDVTPDGVSMSRPGRAGG